MNSEMAIDIVRQELVESGGMLFKIYQKEKIDIEAFDRLKAALIFLIDFYDGKRDIPKRLASAFIDITPLFERAIDFYNQKEQDQIEDIRNKVVSLATDLLFME